MSRFGVGKDHFRYGCNGSDMAMVIFIPLYVKVKIGQAKMSKFGVGKDHFRYGCNGYCISYFPKLALLSCSC